MRSISYRIPAGIGLLVGSLGLAALIPLNSAAASPFNWTQATPTTSPAPRYAHGMAYDSVRGVTVLFGGAAVVGGTVINADDTWEWDGSNWTQRTPSLSPAGRREFAMAYDAARQVTVLFGGIDTAGTFRNDTWEWDGTNWIQMTPATSPAGRIDTAMVYDAAIQKVILFGGLDPTKQNVLQADTWAWDGASWTQLAPAASPSPRQNAAMAYDSVRGRVVLFGGSQLTGGGRLANDTWEFDGSNWLLATPASSPSARYKSAFEYDPALGQTILFGGADNFTLGQTWAWDGSNWTQVSVAAEPTCRMEPRLAYGPLGKLVLFGGWENCMANSAGYKNDTWTGDGSTITPVLPPTPTPTPTPTPSVWRVALTPVTATSVAGGSQSYQMEAYDSSGGDLGNITASTVFHVDSTPCTGNVCSSTAAGHHTVFGDYQTLQANASLTVVGASLDHITISPVGASIVAGQTMNFATEGFDQYNNDLGSVTGATIFSITPDGSCVGAACTASVAGSHTVSGTDSGKSATVTLQVTGNALDHITISPVGASIVAGQTMNFATEGRDQYNNDLGSVTGATILSITPDGSCVAAACTASVAGPHTVTGTDNGKSATATLQVTGSAVDHINLTPPTATIGPDLTVTYSTEAFDQYGNDLGDASAAATYTITPDGTCAGRYCYSTVSGPHTITATYQSKSATASMTVTLGNPTFLTISPTGTTIAAGGHQAYTAQGFDQYRNAFGDVTTATTFSVDNAANPCAANTCTSTVAGQHQVIGIWKGVSNSTGLMVTAGPLASITVLPGSAVLDLGQTLSYDTNGWDAYGNVVTYPADQVSWSVSTGTPGKIIASGGKGSFTASTTTSGSGTVIAKVGTVKGSAAVSVRPGAPTNLKAQKGERRIALSWMSGKADKSFRVYRSTGSGSPVLIASGLTSTSFADTTIRSDTKYTYYVTAVGSTGVESAASNTITVIS